jgi:hypothetical protein
MDSKEKETKVKLWFPRLTDSDARKLKRWWSAHTTGQFAIRPCPENPRFKALYRIQ